MKLLERARTKQVDFPATVSTPYVNTIPADAEPWFPGDEYQERRIRAYIRWNAAAMVTRADARTEGIGGHLSTYASSAALYEVGFNHFFRGKADGGFGDQIFFQGHAAPGIYARAYVEGRLSEAELDNYRHEVGGDGLPSYPHPRSLPDFWEFPTVSMGLGPMSAIYQAHVNRYLNLRHLVDTSGSRVWCFVGDGEMDEPESIGALGVAGREHLDNLIFVVNCNLQRLDGPVRGNGKIIQELEAVFRGAGWKCHQGDLGIALGRVAAPTWSGLLLDRMNATVDGGDPEAGHRSRRVPSRHFFGPDPRLRRMVEDLSDDDLVSLPAAATSLRSSTPPTSSPPSGARADRHFGQDDKGMDARPPRSSSTTPPSDQEDVQGTAPHAGTACTSPRTSPTRRRKAARPTRPPATGSDAMEYLRHTAACSTVRSRCTSYTPSPPQRPDAKVFEVRGRLGTRSVSTTMVFTQLRNLVATTTMRSFVAPIVSDEARTFGLEARSCAEAKIYTPTASTTSRWTADLPLNYAESSSGQVLQEDGPKQGALATFVALATAYTTWGQPMLPVYLLLSMFGSSVSATWPGRSATCMGVLADCAGRVAPRSWARASSTTTASRPYRVRPTPPPWSTTPEFAYEVAIVVEAAVAEMLRPDPKDRFWFLTLYNETYPMPALPEATRGRPSGRGVIAGAYRYTPAPRLPGEAFRPAAVFFRAPCGAWPSRRSACWPSATA